MVETIKQQNSLRKTALFQAGKQVVKHRSVGWHSVQKRFGLVEVMTASAGGSNSEKSYRCMLHA